jgi:hypothetical protein
VGSTPIPPQTEPGSGPEQALRALLGDERSLRGALAEIRPRDDGVTELVERALAWRVAPRLRERLAGLGEQLPEAVLRRLGEACTASAAQSAFVVHRGHQALARLEADGIAAAAMKGVALIGSLYGNPSARMLRDVDLLVQEADVRRACASLATLGFEPFFPDPLERWLAHLRRRSDLDNAYVVLIDPDGLQIDLHWRVGRAPPPPLVPERLLARAIRADLLGRPARVLCPSDSVLLATYHVMHDQLAPGSAIKDLCDLSAWLRRSEQVFTEALVRDASEAGLTAPLLALLRILAGLDPALPLAHLDARLVRQAPGADAAAARLVRLFHLQLREGAINPDVMLLLNPRRAWRLLSARIGHGREDHYFRGLLQSRVGLPASQWPGPGARLQRLWHDLRRLRQGRLALYRALLDEQTRAHVFDGKPGD